MVVTFSTFELSTRQLYSFLATFAQSLSLSTFHSPCHPLSFYVQRGCASEHPIKELKLGLGAEGLSCHRFVANQFRLLLSQAAYILMITLREAAADTSLASAQVERLRSCLIKCAARVQVSPRRIFVELSVSSPFAFEIRQVARNLCCSFRTIYFLFS